MIRKQLVRKLEKFALAGIVVALTASTSRATTTGLPWEGPLTMIKDSLTGPVALAISLIAILVCGAMLIFGGEIGDFAKKLIMLVLVISLVVGGASMLSTVFGFTAAVL